MRLVPAIALLLLLSACGHHDYTPQENQQLYKVGNPYQVGNRWYKPKEDPYYDEVGEASWYGPGFHGHKTADGEEFDKYDLTAAHRTLPMPSMVRVTNLENGKSAILRVNDRGPFAKKRIIDVSKKAADVLGFAMKGMTRVRVQFLPEETAALFGGTIPESALAKAYATPKPTQYAASKKRAPQIYQAPEQNTSSENTTSSVQVGLFRKKQNAERVVSDVSRFGVAKMEEIHQEGERFFRVRIGSFSSTKEAERVLNLIQESGYNDAQFINF